MIEIKDRWSDRVLYTASSAQDVRAAVTHAVRAGADLAGADLAGANLTGANLTGADLTGAYLTGAYLTGADLTGAYLTGADLTGANLARAYLARAYLAGAYLAGANLTGAYLTGADLTGADLTGAYLARAYLAGADLTRAYLTRAYLAGAYLAGAEGVNKHLTTPLYLLLEQTGKIRAYKLVDSQYRSPIQSMGKLVYKVGDTIEVSDASTDEHEQCAAGINVATLDWCLRAWKTGYRILVVEFTRKDIAAVPVGSDGKFRVRRVKVVSEKPLADVGLEPVADSAGVS